VVVELPCDPETGKRRQKWVTVKGTKRDAERVLAEMGAQVERGFPGTAPARMTVGEYLEKWLEAIRGTVRPTTAAKYATEVRRLTAAVGNILVSKLTPADVQAAAARLPETLAPATRRRTFDTLRAALRRAVEWGLLARDPLAGVKPPSTPVREVRVWSEEEAMRFLEAAKGSRYYALFYLALATGMRSGELLGLTWDDIDLTAGTVTVRRALARVSGGAPVWQDPKTPAARRRIPIDPLTVEVLRQHRKQQAEERLRAGPAWQDYRLVFCTRSGRPVIHANLYYLMRSIAKRAGVPPIRFHDLRHTHATILLRQGVHPKMVAERLGSRVAVTLDTYSHVLPDTQAEAARVIGQVLSSGRRPPR
jgi:integrase